MQNGTQELLLCKDCKHAYIRWYDKYFATGNNRYYYKCLKNYKGSKEDDNLVTGPKMLPGEYETCSMTRLNSQPCGETGKLWQPKDPKNLFMYMKRV